MTAPSVLLVEDDHLAAEQLRGELESRSFRVVVSHSCAEAEARLDSAEPIEVALLDYKLPDGTGADFGKGALRRRGIPFLLMSGYTDDAVWQAGADAGAYGFVAKPTDGANLVPALQTALARANENRRLVELVERVTNANDSKRLTSTACGILMERFGLNADEAHRLVRYYARSNRITLDEAAHRILGRRDAFELLSALRRLADKHMND